MTSLQDIAQELNVSVSLVSKVLSGRMSTSGASPRTAQAIRAKARELGYRPNRAASALASGRQQVLGVFLHRTGTRGSGLTASLLGGISRAAAEADQRLWLEFFQTTQQFRRRQPDIHRSDVDGMIVGGIAHSELAPELLRAEAAGVPIVTVHEAGIHPELPNVGADQSAGIAMATAHLLEQGVRRPMLIGVAPDVSDATERAIRAGFERALAGRGMTVSREQVFHLEGGGYTYEAGEAAVAHWLERGLSFDGIVAVSDLQALGAMHTLLRRGVSIPEQVKLVGVDNSPLAEAAIVPLSSICKRYEQRGRMAVQMLMKRIDGQDVESVTITPTLYPRASSLAAG